MQHRSIFKSRIYQKQYTFTSSEDDIREMTKEIYSSTESHKKVCDGLPASLFDWHKKKRNLNENIHIRTHAHNDRKLCETYFIDIDEPFFEPKWKYALFPTQSTERSSQKREKLTILVDFDLVWMKCEWLAVFVIAIRKLIVSTNGEFTRRRQNVKDV